MLWWNGKKKECAMKRVIFSVFPIIVATAFSAASAYTLTGTVKDKDDSSPVKATVKLLKKGKETETDQAGKFTIHEDDAVSIREFRGAIGHFSLMNGILNFSQGSSAPVQVKVFDVAGNQVLNKTLQGSGSIDLAASIGAQGTYVAKIRLGSAQETVRFTSYGNAAGSLGATEAHSLRKEGDDSDTLRVVADQYDTLFVPLANLDTTLDLKLRKASTKQTYAFGWPKGNDPVPTRGCGKDTQLSKSGQFKFTWTYKGESTTRDVYYDLPNNYDKNKPYRLIFGMQCMGGSAQNVARNENYYGMKPFDKEGTTIFVAPDGKCHENMCAPWEEKDYAFFDELLAKLESELCIDSSRVFSAGFSYGSMYSNMLSRSRQDVLRGVAVYETADVNIAATKNTGKPIAWMGVHGMSDGLCTPAMGRSARDTALKNASAEGKDATKEKAQESNSGQHTCYDYKDVDERFPVKWCTDNAGHQWDHRDPGQGQSWVPQTTWEFFTQF